MVEMSLMGNNFVGNLVELKWRGDNLVGRLWV